VKEESKLHLIFILVVLTVISPCSVFAEKKTEIVTTINETELNFVVEVEKFLEEGITIINFTVILKELLGEVHSIDGMIIVFQIKNSQSITYLFEETITTESLSLSEENDSRSEISQFYYYKEWGRISIDLSLIIHENITGSTLEYNDPNWVSNNFNDFLTLQPEYFLRKHYYVILIGLGAVGLFTSIFLLRKRMRSRKLPQYQRIISYCTRCGSKTVYNQEDFDKARELFSYCPNCAEYYIYYKQ
jgi:hypothetical protein